MGKALAEASAEARAVFEEVDEALGQNLFKLMTELASAKREYDRVAQALASVRETGYGLVSPEMSELKLEQPEIVRAYTVTKPGSRRFLVQT